MSRPRRRSFLFLPCQQSTTTPQTIGHLNSEARIHIWRQSALKAAHGRRGLRIIPSIYSADTTPDTTVTNKIEKPVDRQHGDQEEQAFGLPSQITYVATDIAHNPGPDGSFDSLSSLALQDLTQNEKFLLHYAFNRTLPVFGESDEGKQSFSRSWISRSLSSPMVLNAQISGSSTHYTISTSLGCPTHPFLTAGLKGKIKAIQALQFEIDSYRADSAEVNNDLLLAMFILAIHGGLESCDELEPHPLSPLATHRDLNVYGRMTFCDEHTNALYYLIEKSGGLSCLDQAAFHCVLPVWDLVNSFRKGSRPRFPRSRQAKSIIRSGLWDPDEEARWKLATLGEAFRPLPDGTWPLFLTSTMARPLLVMAEITAALDHFCRGGEGAPKSLDALLNNCDWATYEFLCFRPNKRGLRPVAPDGEILDPSPPELLREICRLSGLLYINMVIFPLPPNSGIKARLSKGILRLIKAFERIHGSADLGVIDFLTWATFLGAIATRFTGPQAYYRDRIAMVARNKHWEAVLKQLEKYLWFGPVCDRPAIELWTEACQGTTAMSQVGS